MMARISDLDYFVDIKIPVRFVRTTRLANGTEDRKEITSSDKRQNLITLCRLPVMVLSKYCSLHGEDLETRIRNGEC